MLQYDVLLYVIVFSISSTLQYIFHRYMKNLGYKLNNSISVLVSITTGVLSTYLLYRYGVGYEFIKYVALIQILMVISFVDLSYKIIPNRLNLMVGVIGIIDLVITKDFYSSIVAFFIAGGLFLALALLSNGGIGGGDIKLIAPLGLIFGILPIAYIISYTFIFGAVFGIGMLLLGKKSLVSEIALAPYISLATLMFITYLR